MPLPPALLKRLASRGLVESRNKIKSKKLHPSAEKEEVIAEDYDEMEDPLQYDQEPVKKPQENYWIESMKRRIVEGNNAGYKGCPNKYNIFHKCTLFCVTRWGDGIEPKRSYVERKFRLLKKYPLPKNWVEIYDHGCGSFYFWNSTDDTVCWLPPTHPKAQISKSAAALRRELEEILPPNIEEEETGELTQEDIDKILDAPLLPPPQKISSNLKKSSENASLPAPKKTKSRDLDKALRHQESKRKRDTSHRGKESTGRHRYKKAHTTDSEPLDPMDPAAYSDIPRGKWSDGLNPGASKTGVDPTVSGSLFQMRPYPSPGAVLLANAESKGANIENKTAVDSGEEDD